MIILTQYTFSGKLQNNVEKEFITNCFITIDTNTTKCKQNNSTKSLKIPLIILMRKKPPIKAKFSENVMLK